jgi:hypothetical protein
VVWQYWIAVRREEDEENIEEHTGRKLSSTMPTGANVLDH